MKSIFWCQSPSSDGESIYNIDGKTSEFSNTPQQIEAFSVLENAAKWYQVCQKPEIHIRHSNGIMIKSHLQSTDDIHRRITYMFYTSNYTKASLVLKEYAAMCNLETMQEDLVALDDAIILYKKHLKKIMIIVSAIIFAILILFFITKK